MIFMSQSGLIEAAQDAAREADWDAWYIEHLRIMVTVPGIDSAQRFRTDSPGHPPSLAMYTIDSAAVFTDAYYQSVRGMGPWAALIARQHYKRNLFDGLRSAPAIARGSVLLIEDRTDPDPSEVFNDRTWLRCVGLDQTTAFRALGVASDGDSARWAGPGIAEYRPVTDCYSKARS